ncbi:Aste57867_22327 [Aphanomyces stellatus]|uniref:Aste57867_22327 protein n=1 Tax=Aphanomyces stellatus TaxID=120398 RepID=A0A485LJT5_9STRA|nr:hypothetical protein As57867_022257 [Aphanomyces stellatus]VFT98990.1 Aste57867_22327 [Aphanomyces stellatus]
MLEVIDKVLLRRRYNREKQRAHRRKLADACTADAHEIHQLRATVAALELQLPLAATDQVDSDGALSWRLVVDVFRATSSRSLATQRVLLQDAHLQGTLAARMHRFVTLNLHSASILRRSQSKAWQPATLLAEPQARKLGKEWLTQRMYHHTDAALRCFPMDVTSTHEYGFFSTREVDGSLSTIEDVQATWPCSMDTVRVFLRDHLHLVIFRDPTGVRQYLFTTEEVSNTKLYRKLTAKGSWINYLQGYFVEANRVVVVVRQIEADADTPSFNQQAHFMAWVEARALSPTQVVTRWVTRQSLHFRPNEDGYFSAGEQAELWGVDLAGVPEADKMEALRRDIVREGNAVLPHWRQNILGILSSLRQAP